MLKYIVIHCGYAESNTTSALIYQCEFFGNPGYTSYKTAITDLALDLYAKFYDGYLSVYENRYSKQVKDCCRKVLTADKNAKFCSECGKQIADKQFDHEEFMDYIRGLHSSTCDSYGEAEYVAGRHLTWWPFGSGNFIGAPKEEVIYIAEYAEVVLLSALFDAKPELRTGDDDDFDLGDWKDFKKEIQPTYR
jgi:hypothetical protein